ncbi:hypothetical protein KOR42_19810 [Thalassoglobus neptunius]|uniref:Endonuclease III n=1 Tax=Thalassoglobus neptunius TaxID=1938619 RepID=A0A5C5X7G4_9PLAN|nr:hypothetical protein [Thalassoglobus neptunius]TWT58599.1 hypothetical protein KOR42_19810 [Thalassoglobus neptunius]
MPASKSLKAADKQKILKKLVTEMKKHVKGSVPKHNHTVLETVLYSACLENVSYEAADQAYSNLLDTFFDLNEVRVSSVAEIVEALGDVHEADWKALRVRETLQDVFEKNFAFDLEILKRKTQEVANKELSEIPHISPFMRDFTVQHALGAHVLPVDDKMTQLLKWLGLVEASATSDQAADAIKAGIKKSEGPQFCFLMKSVSVDPVLQPGLEQYQDLDPETDPFACASRLADLYKNPVKPKRAKSATKKVSRKKPEAKTSTRKTAKKAATKSKTTAKKVKKPTKTAKKSKRSAGN